MLLSAPRGKSEEKQQTAFFGSTRATPRTCAVAPYRSKAFAAERVHERLRKRGGMGHEAEVSAGEINDLSAQLPRQHPVWLGGHLVVRSLISPADTSASCPIPPRLRRRS